MGRGPSVNTWPAGRWQAEWRHEAGDTAAKTRMGGDYGGPPWPLTLCRIDCLACRRQGAQVPGPGWGGVAGTPGQSKRCSAWLAGFHSWRPPLASRMVVADLATIPCLTQMCPAPSIQHLHPRLQGGGGGSGQSLRRAGRYQQRQAQPAAQTCACTGTFSPSACFRGAVGCSNK